LHGERTGGNVAASLSEEQKRRIETEEQSHAAEESYRKEVRDSLQRSKPSEPKPNLKLIIFVVTVLILGALWIAFDASKRPIVAEDSPSAPQATWFPDSAPLAMGQFRVPAQNYLAWRFVVPSVAVRNYRVKGHYSVVGGSGNDIQAVVATEDEFQNWINGHQSRPFYASPGKVTTGDLDSALPPGHYVLAFSNRFSVLTDKAVFAEIKATYEQTK
jgi:hypothetical protein